MSCCGGKPSKMSQNQGTGRPHTSKVVAKPSAIASSHANNFAFGRGASNNMKIVGRIAPGQLNQSRSKRKP